MSRFLHTNSKTQSDDVNSYSTWRQHRRRGAHRRSALWLAVGGGGGACPPALRGDNREPLQGWSSAGQRVTDGGGADSRGALEEPRRRSREHTTDLLPAQPAQPAAVWMDWQTLLHIKGKITPAFKTINSTLIKYFKRVFQSDCVLR